MVVIKLLIIWLIMVASAILNGILREKILNRYLGEKAALPVSGLSLSVIVFSVCYAAIDYFARETILGYIALGCYWVLLTLAFEYVFGRFVRGLSWSQMNDVFNVTTGNLFVLVLLVTAFAPLLSAYLKGYI